MWKRLRRRATKIIEEKKTELEEKEVPELGLKKEPVKEVSKEREIADKAMDRLLTFMPKVKLPAPIDGKPVIEVYNQYDAHRDFQTVLQYLMNKVKE